ncbi:hypothetical protein [Frateuria hangzhouensis]|uniref:hypothetical protein n=1 Tax=Frateuria hangzhouensis TaxID=2995589 RepID=UPI003CCC5836
MLVCYATTSRSCADQVDGDRSFVVREANWTNKWALMFSALQMALIVVRIRPHVVLTTGAAPGYFALVFGKMMRAKTIWIDSVANAEEMSLAGSRVRPWADQWLTQWREIADAEGPRYLGSVL